MCDSGGDTESDCSGISPADEDRVKRLFLACDYNGDGFIDRFFLLILFITFLN